MYDIAREQSPTESGVREMLARSQKAGYNAVAFYLEHRFAYNSAPWAADTGCLTPELARKMQAEFPKMRVIPFLNTLGHMEGFIRSEGGQWLAEGPSAGSQQMCPSRPECVDFARKLVSDAMEAFNDDWVHLGGDETTQLGQCPLCSARAEKIGKAGIYAEYFAPLCEWVLEQGRRPCLWGDMLIEHPSVLEKLPKETVIFDWQYWDDPTPTTKKFREAGFDVVCCPSVHTYDSAWCYLDSTRRNIDEHKRCAEETGSLGVLVTTWEFSYFTNYESTLPVIYSAGRRLSSGEDWHDALVEEAGPEFAEDCEILGVTIPNMSEFLRAPGWRKLRDSFVIKLNPFYLWQDWREEACGAIGDKILELCRNCSANLFPAVLLTIVITWVRAVERAALKYKTGDIEGAAGALSDSSHLLLHLYDWMEHYAKGGGSHADVKRAELLWNKVRQAEDRLRKLSGSEYLPAFEVLIHDAYVLGDQAAWKTGSR